MNEQQLQDKNRHNIENAKLAVYTTVYPGVEKYLRDFIDSICNQTDKNFDVWVGVDDFPIEKLEQFFDGCCQFHPIIAKPFDTPAIIRHNAITSLVDLYPAIIFVDSDDVLFPGRVEKARLHLQNTDIYGCALELINESGDSLNRCFQYDNSLDLSDTLPESNVFGLSNTAYRTEVLKNLLPIPPQCILVDWYLATVAWLNGFSFYFDNNAYMAYRQYEANTARVLPPFSKKQVLRATEYVLSHYHLMAQNNGETDRLKFQKIIKASQNAKEFHQRISEDEDLFDQYVVTLNERNKAHIWWDFVAAPELEDLWKR